MTSTDVHERTFELHIEPGNVDDLKLRVSGPHGDELLVLLAEAGIKASLGAEFSAGQKALELINVAIQSKEAWGLVGATLSALVARRNSSEVHLKSGDDEITIKGKSDRQAKRYIDAFLDKIRKRLDDEEND